MTRFLLIISIDRLSQAEVRRLIRAMDVIPRTGEWQQNKAQTVENENEFIQASYDVSNNELGCKISPRKISK